MFPAPRVPGTAAGVHPRHSRHENPPELDEVVASYRDGFSPPVLADARYGSDSGRPFIPPRPPTELASPTTSSICLREGSPAAAPSETRIEMSNRDDLIPSCYSPPRAPARVDQPHIVQRAVDRDDIRFEDLRLPQAPAAFQASILGDVSISAAARAPSATTEGNSARAPSPDDRRTVARDAKKRGCEDEHAPYHRRRTGRRILDVYDVSVDTGDSTRRSGQFKHIPAAGSVHAHSSALSQPVVDQDSVNPNRVRASLPRSYVPVAHGAPVDGGMDVSAAAYRTGPVPGSGATSHAQEQHGRPEMNLPPQANSVSNPGGFQFSVHTPRQNHTLLSRSATDLRARKPPPPTPTGPLDTHTIPRHMGTYLEKDGPLPPFADIERHADGVRGFDAPASQQARRPLADITPDEHPTDDDQENIPPLLHREHSRGFSMLRRRESSHGFSDPREQERDFFIPRGHVVSRTVLLPSALPPSVASASSASDARPWPDYRSPVTPRIPSGRPGHSGVATTLSIIKRLRAPRGGYPAIYFDDHDSLVSGCDETFVLNTRTDKLQFKDESPPLVARFVLPEGLAPGEVPTSMLHHAHRAISEITGETRFWIIPPLVTRNPVYDPSVLAIAWFVRGLTKRGAARMLAVRVITTSLVTFFVFPHTVEPRVCLTLGGFWSTVVAHIEGMIRATFFGPTIFKILSQAAAGSPLFRGVRPERAVECLLETLVIKVSTLPGGAVFACAYLTFPGVEPITWRYLRAAIATVPFKDGYNCQAVPLHCRCGVCGGNDHPDEMCIWPTLEGWTGPVPSAPERAHEREAHPGTMILSGSPERARDTRGSGTSRRHRNYAGPRSSTGEGPSFSMGGNGGRGEFHDSGAAGPSRTG